MRLQCRKQALHKGFPCQGQLKVEIDRELDDGVEERSEVEVEEGEERAGVVI